LLCTFLLVSGLAVAQNTSRGDVIIGGSTADLFNYVQREEAPGGDFDGETALSVNTVYVGFNTYAGFFIRDGFEIGPEAIFEFRRETAAGIVDMSTDLALGAQLGYFGQRDTKTIPYFRLAMAFVSTTFETNGNDAGETGFSITPRAGLVYFLADEVGINFNGYVNYLRAIDVDPDQDLEAREFDIGVEIGLVLTLNWPTGQL
jgi:hypothetical protein